MQPSKVIKDFPRRSNMGEWAAEEKQIYEAMQAVEKLGAHPLLTEVVVLLGQAQNKLADWIETDVPYWQAEIVGKDGNLTGLTLDEQGCVCCVGTGIKFKNETLCIDFINKRKQPEMYKATEHIDIRPAE